MTGRRIVPIVLVLLVVGTLTGCARQSATSPPITNTTGSATKGTASASVQAFITQESKEIQAINQGFTEESNLFKEVSTKQISYSTFRSSYNKSEFQVKSSIHALAAANAPSGAKTYQLAYVTLLQQGLQVFADQEKAIRPNGTIDSSKVTVLKKELDNFVTQSQKLAAKYGIQ